MSNTLLVNIRGARNRPVETIRHFCECFGWGLRDSSRFYTSIFGTSDDSGVRVRMPVRMTMAQYGSIIAHRCLNYGFAPDVKAIEVLSIQGVNGHILDIVEP